MGDRIEWLLLRNLPKRIVHVHTTKNMLQLVILTTESSTIRTGSLDIEHIEGSYSFDLKLSKS